MANQKHIFDFEGILSMDINQKNWREIKQKLDSAFGELKIGIAEGMAKAEVEKHVKMLNQVFAKVEMPDIGVDDLKNQFDQVAESFTKAIASLHNIDISSLKNIEGTLDHLATQVDKIVDKVGKGVPKATKSAILSVKKLDEVLGKIGDSADEIGEALNFSVEGDVKKQSAALRKLAAEWENLNNQFEQNGAESAKDWVKRQQAMAKYVQVYESYVKIAKKPNKDLTTLYDKLLPQSYDARTNLQNLVDRRAGTFSEHKEPWAREETLKKVLDVLKNGIKVEDKGGDKGKNQDSGINLKAEIAKEQAQIEVNTKKIQDITNKLQKNATYVMYRGVNEEEHDKFETRSDIYHGDSGYGAEYYIGSKRIAGEYAPDDDGNGHVVEAEIRPQNAIIYDAKGANYQDVVTNKDFIDWFKKQHSSFAKLDLSTNSELATDNQLAMNQAAGKAGFDAIIFDNILDHIVNDSVGEGTKDHTQLSQTIAVLNDAILSITGFFEAQDGKISNRRTADVPSYYLMPEDDGNPKHVVERTSEGQERIQLTKELNAAEREKKMAEKRIKELNAQLVDAPQDSISSNEPAQTVVMDGVATEETLHKILDHLTGNKTKQTIPSQSSADGERFSSEIIELINSLAASKNTKEKYAYLNMQTGIASKYIEGAEDSVSVKDIVQLLKEDSRDFDSTLHTHPKNIAVPSGKDGDLQIFENQLEQFKKHFILAGNQIAEIDFTGLTSDIVKQIKDNFIEKESGIDEDFDSPIQDIVNVSKDVYSKFYQELDNSLAQSLSKVSEKKGINSELLDQIIREYVPKIKEFFNSNDVTKLSRDQLNNELDAISGDALSAQPKEIQKVLRSSLAGYTSIIFEKISGIDTAVSDKMQQELQVAFIETLNDLNLDASKIFKTHNIQDFVNLADPHISEGSGRGNERKGGSETSGNKVSIDAEELKRTLNAIIYNVKVAHDADIEDNKVSIDEDALKQLLNSIVYNVKIAQDNNDVVSAIQELSNRLGSMVGQDDSLQGIKSVLESIKASGFNVDISPENITTAIKEALYAKDIAKYRTYTFDEAFTYDEDLKAWENNLWQNYWDDQEDAVNEFNREIKGKYFAGDEIFEQGLSKQELLDKIIASKQPKEVEQQNLVQVVVDAINTQSGKIIEAIKLIIPENVTDGVDESKLIEAFNSLTAAINQTIDGTWNDPKAVMQWLLDGTLSASDLGISDALRTLGMMSESGAMQFKLASTGSMNQGVAIGENMVYRAADERDVNDVFELMEKQNEAYKLGAAVPRILAAMAEDGRIFQLQTRAPGVNLRKDGFDEGVLNATNEQIDRLIHTFEVLEKVGLHAEFGGDNIMYDKNKGFSMIDLDNEEDYMWSGNTAAEMLQGLIDNIERAAGGTQEAEDFIDRVKDRYMLSPDQRLVNEQTIEAERAAAAAQGAKGQGASDPKVLSTLGDISKKGGTLIAQEKTLQTVADKLDNVKIGGSEEITNAIKEAMFAPEIAAGYHKPEFDEVFEYDWDAGLWQNKIFGNIWQTHADAVQEYDEYLKDLYLSNDGMWAGTKSEMLDNIAGVKGYGAEQDNWAQVVVEAINTQGGRIVEAIKIILPQNISDTVTAGSGLDETKIRNAFDVLTDAILRFNDATGEAPRDFFGKLRKDDLTASVFRDADVDDALRTLGLMDGNGKMTFTMPDTGIRNLGVAIADRLVVTTQDAENVNNMGELQAKLDEAAKLGANLPRILGVVRGGLRDQWANDAIFQLQTKAPGVNIASGRANGEFANASSEQIDKLIHTFEVMSKVGLFPDFIGDNVLFDEKKGFSLVDIETENIGWSDMSTPQDMAEEFLSYIYKHGGLSDTDFDAFSNKVRERVALPSDQRLVDEFGNLKATNAGAFTAQIIPTMDDGAVAKVVQENILKTPATVKLTPEMDETVSSPVEQLAENLTNKIVDWRKYDGAIETLQEDPLLSQLGQFTLLPSEMMSFEPAKMQEIITDWINRFVSNGSFYEGSPGQQFQSLLNSELAKLQPVQADDATSKVSIDAEELKNVLNAITYNVKVVQDEDGADNKVAIDEASLKTTLNEVFTNILNPQTQPNDSEHAQEPLALENTLQTVKGVLDNIQSNTAKFDTIKISNVDAIAGTTLESKLTEIKTVLESIEKKIVDGGKIFNRGGAKQAFQESQKTPAQEQAARSNMMKSLINDYKTMGKLAAQFANDGNLETKAMLENLKEEIARKRQSLKLTMDENKSLREKYSIAFDAEKRLLDAAKAQEEIDKKARQQDKDDQAAWKKKVKDAQRATGINAATTAANAGDQTVVRAIGTKGITKDIENKAQELSKQIKTLRQLRDDIDQKGDDATDKDKERLSQQIVQVKKLKTEVDGYLKLHEKYSGEDATQFDVDTSNFGAVGTDQYWNSITAEIQKASGSRVIIKGMNTDTGELTGTTKIAANTFAEWSATVDPMTGKLSMVRTGIKKTETLMEAIARKTKEVFTYFSGSSIIFKAFNELKKGVQYVREIDSALTELKKVTDETEETYDKFLKTAAKTADKVGSTIQKVVSSTADWARLGYSMEEAAKFAETTQILMNVSEFTDVSQATDTLISSVQAFGYTAETSMDVVDLLNTIGKQYCRCA